MSLIASRRPLIQALQNFEKCQVEVRIWGAPYPPIPFGALVLTSVNALGAGIHIFFSIDGDASMHLKVAQPGDSTITPNTVVISTARYIQWNGKKISQVGNAPALFLARTMGP